MEIFIFSSRGNLMFWEDDSRTRIFFSTSSENREELSEELRKLVFSGSRQERFDYFSSRKVSEGKVKVLFTEGIFQAERDFVCSLFKGVFPGKSDEDILNLVYPESVAVFYKNFSLKPKTCCDAEGGDDGSLPVPLVVPRYEDGLKFINYQDFFAPESRRKVWLDAVKSYVREFIFHNLRILYFRFIGENLLEAILNTSLTHEEVNARVIEDIRNYVSNHYQKFEFYLSVLHASTDWDSVKKIFLGLLGEMGSYTGVSIVSEER